MTPKQTAIIRTSIIMGSGIIASIAIAIIMTILTIAQIGILLCVVGLVFLAKVVYDIELNKAENNQ